MLRCVFEVNGKSCYEEIMNKIIWINNFLCYDKKSMYRRDVVNLGLDLISANKLFSCDFSSLTNPEQRFFLMSIINSIPAEWRSLIKASTNVTLANPIPITPTILMASRNVVPILDISSKQIFQVFCGKSKLRPSRNRNYQTGTQI